MVEEGRTELVSSLLHAVQKNKSFKALASYSLKQLVKVMREGRGQDVPLDASHIVISVFKSQVMMFAILVISEPTRSLSMMSLYFFGIGVFIVRQALRGNTFAARSSELDPPEQAIRRSYFMTTRSCND